MYLNEVPRVVTFVETESKMVAVRGMGKECLRGTKFELEKTKHFWRQLAMAVQHCEYIPSTTELHTYKWFKW